MSYQESFDEIMVKVNQHWDSGTQEQIQIAYNLISDAALRFPDDASIQYICYNYRYCAAALLNQPDLSIEIFQEAVEAGYWWSEEYLRSDEDLKILQDLPAFNHLVEECNQKRQTASSGVKTVSLLLPLPAQTAETFPLLLALHGNTHNAKNSAPYWESAVEKGWLTVLPQSSQQIFLDGYVWDDLELGGREIKDHYHELEEKYQIDTGRVVAGGFSKGGEMAIWLALMEIIPLAGFIAVNPGGPYIGDINKWEPLLENCKTITKMRGYFVAGEYDPNVEKIKALYKLLESRGMACELVVSPSIAHAFPKDFNQTLARALQYLPQ